MKLLDWLLGQKPDHGTPGEFLAEVQRQDPPLLTGGSDLGRRVHQRLNARIRPGLRDLFARGDVVIGEVGILSPNALAEFVPPRGYAILELT